MTQLASTLRGNLVASPLFAPIRSLLVQAGAFLSAAVQRSPGEHPLP